MVRQDYLQNVIRREFSLLRGCGEDFLIQGFRLELRLLNITGPEYYTEEQNENETRMRKIIYISIGELLEML